MATSQRRILLVLFVAVLLTFTNSNMLFAKIVGSVNSPGNTDIVGDQEGDASFDDDLDAVLENEEGEKIEVNKIIKKSKKYRKTKSKLSPAKKRQKLIERELKRFENANKSILSREKKAKKILKKAGQDREKELIKHDRRIQEIGEMEFND
ncbi:MAG: hypothetical protein PF574_10155 [Candidatus Delongbacteria bacterium]|jgi:hypothetical protein|nr:hypothetical protein [Candidatus Delongbacteria bacterium]